VEQAITKAIDALKARDLEASRCVIAGDDLIRPPAFPSGRAMHLLDGYATAPGH
jgi:hypothetical protein